MQSPNFYGEWTVAIEFLNIQEGKALLFDVGFFGSVDLFVSNPDKRYFVGVWYGVIDDLLDKVVLYTKNPDHPDMTAEVRYENSEIRLAGTLSARDGKYLTAMELRPSEHSDDYTDLHESLCVDCLKKSMPHELFMAGIKNVTAVLEKAIMTVSPRMTPAHIHNSLALEAALVAESEHNVSFAVLLDTKVDAYSAAWLNAIDRLSSVLVDLNLDVCKLSAYVVAMIVFPTVGIRLIGSLRNEKMRLLNEPITDQPSPSEFSDSFPL